MRAGDQSLLQVVLTRGTVSQVVRLTVSDLPAGVAGTFTDPSLEAGEVASTLLFTATRETTPGTYTAVVTASAQGVNAQALPVALTITRASSIELTAKPESVSVIAGGSASITLDLARTDYTGSVYFEAEGAPEGVTASFPDSPTTSSLATANISATSDVLPGVYVFVINAYASGLPPANTFVQLTVLAPSVVGFDLQVNPELVTLIQGEQDSATVLIGRKDYDGQITFSAVGLPPGVVATFSPQVTKGNSVTLTFFTGDNTPPGSYPLTVVATGEGGVTMAANADIIVLPTPAFSIAVTPDSLTIAAGDSAHATVSLVRTNLPGDIQLSVTALPAGASLTFESNPTMHTSVPIRIVLDPATMPGTYVIGIHAVVQGFARDAALTLTVKPPS